jgi:hypothetical protein
LKARLVDDKLVFAPAAEHVAEPEPIPQQPAPGKVA